MPADHGTPNTAPGRENEVEAVEDALTKASGMGALTDWQIENAARLAIDALDRARDARSDEEACGTCGGKRDEPGMMSDDAYSRFPCPHPFHRQALSPPRDARSDTVAWSQLREAARRYVDETRGLGERPDIDEMFDVLMDEFEQCARSDTVAVEDVLAFYANEDNWRGEQYIAGSSRRQKVWGAGNAPVLRDGGARARQALAEFGGRAATDDHA